jgi:hypothetical protein
MYDTSYGVVEMMNVNKGSFEAVMWVMVIVMNQLLMLLVLQY